MNFPPFGNHFPTAAISTIQQFSAKFGHESSGATTGGAASGGGGGSSTTQGVATQTSIADGSNNRLYNFLVLCFRCCYSKCNIKVYAISHSNLHLII